MDICRNRLQVAIAAIAQNEPDPAMIAVAQRELVAILMQVARLLQNRNVMGIGGGLIILVTTLYALAMIAAGLALLAKMNLEFVTLNQQSMIVTWGKSPVLEMWFHAVLCFGFLLRISTAAALAPAAKIQYSTLTLILVAPPPSNHAQTPFPVTQGHV